ncbi:hypothetical protein TW95_gp0833 [Pandoravirus inopinatum]|uniref:Ankyrin repeat protein n=1 Tax=Pandoravirus inopinatum TaxID=1605721 RepID=A0A0B5JD07_9VIRU|nr:hypothetical protein TW95_gp0833 [Pandoravirus inopinatum]AJF97567.1 hypothetical protein [Pandoravirus inopinatum]
MHHHSLVRASGMALMVRHGLPTNAMGAWTTQGPDLMDVAAVLMASGVSERVDEAALVAAGAPESEKWCSHIRRLGLRVGPHGPLEGCTQWWGTSFFRNVLVAAAAGSWQDLAALAHVVGSHTPWCIGIAALHAARHDRADAVRALLAIVPSDDNGIMRFIGGALGSMWMLVGRHGLLSVADLLVDIEQGSDPIVRFTEDERLELASERQDSDKADNGWNWLASAAKRNHTECLDLCERRGLDDKVPDIAVAAAALQRHVEFYDRVKAHTLSLASAVAWGIEWHLAMHPNALPWIVDQPEFDPFCNYPLSNHQLNELFVYARDRGASDSEILQAAAVITRRWPDVWER